MIYQEFALLYKNLLWYIKNAVWIMHDAEVSNLLNDSEATQESRGKHGPEAKRKESRFQKEEI